MEPLSISLIAFTLALVVGTAAIHSVGTYFLLWGAVKVRVRSSGRGEYMWLTVGVTIRILALLLLHMLEVLLWGALFYQQGFFPDLRTSFYFSLTTYVTVGYGDVVLPEQYRMLGGIEGLVGVLMLGWSTALITGYLQRVYSQLIDRWEGPHQDT
jgi:hypothetical protein